jgi:hypothetical protein
MMKKNLIKLMVGGVFLNLGMFPLLAQAQPQVSDAQVSALVEALRQAAPKSNSPSDRYYSEWRVKPETLKGWSKFCLKKELTPKEFEANPATARQVVSCITRRELDKQFSATGNKETASVRGVACWWMTGNYTGCNSGFTGAYVEKVVGFYQKERAKPARSPSRSPG